MNIFRGFKIFAADKIHPAGLSLLNKYGFKVLEKYGLSNSTLIEFIRSNTTNKDIYSCLIIRSVRRFTNNEIRELSNTPVKIICTASSGFDNIPLDTCRKYSIKVLSVPGGNFISAAEHTMALLLNILKNVNKANLDTKSGNFNSLEYMNYELSGKTVGIIGVGRVGSHFARLCKAFGAKIVGNDVKRSLSRIYKWIEFKNLKNLLMVSDIISVHTQLDASTVNLLNSDNLGLLKKTSIVINCARGGIINEKTLIKYLKMGKIYYAGLDVFENEPDINNDFAGLKNVVLTPHIGGKTVESKVRISMLLAENIMRYYTVKKYK